MGWMDEGVMVTLIDGASNEKLLFSEFSSFMPPSAFILMYDITDRKPLFNLDGWIKKIRKLWKDYPIVIIGHKWDEISKRKIKIEEGQKIAKDYKTLFFETSISDKLSIDIAVNSIKEIVLREIE